MEPENQRDIRTGLYNGKITYKVTTDLTTSFKKANISMSSDNVSNLTIPCTIFTNDYECYIAQSYYNTIENSNTLHIMSFDEENKFFLAEELLCTLDEWLEQKLVEGEEGDRRSTIRRYCDGGNPMLWWMKIMKNFKDVFGSVTYGLGAIHRAKAFHGNLLKGVAVKNKQGVVVKNDEGCTPMGILFNMTKDPRQEEQENIEHLQLKDIKDLRKITKRALLYPYVKSNSRTPDFVDECVWLCFMQLDGRILSNVIEAVEATSLKGIWGLNLAIFWKAKEQIIFMERVYRLLYHALPKYTSYNYYTIRFFNWGDWVKKVQTCGSQRMQDVLIFNGKNAYKTSNFKYRMDKLRYWRNCIKHMDLDHSSNKANHEEVLRFFPELFFEVIKAFHDVFHIQEYKPSVKSLFTDMEWE